METLAPGTRSSKSLQCLAPQRGFQSASCVSAGSVITAFNQCMHLHQTCLSLAQVQQLQANRGLKH